ncbi:AAA family ATPase [Kribbella solani]|uniref:AAA family ATPase n=1 Tax=Kribbella solani TaxID=236067 RepID=UPI0029A2DC1F|nr:ATP-binding protein [Kribbella solani]MDX2974438.1 ATP-binding protein [Kribbella solani]
MMVLIVGLPGAGKSSWARKVEADRQALRLTPDEWMDALFGAGEADGRRWVLESELLWSIAARTLALGVDVILDYGCWSEEERELFRTRAAQQGASTQLVLLDPPFEVLSARIERRNANLPPATFPIRQSDLRDYQAQFERPTTKELQRWDQHLVLTD